MDYRRIYDNLITSRKQRVPLDGIYYEKHHIVMRSMGGTDDKYNLVHLTAREHFIAHRLLWLIHRNKSAWYAFKFMCFLNKNMSGRLYEEMRKEFSVRLKQEYADGTRIPYWKGRKTWNFGKKAKDLENGETWIHNLSVSHKGQQPWMKGKKHSVESRRKSSESHKGQIPWNTGKNYKHRSQRTAEHILKLSEAAKRRTVEGGWYNRNRKHSDKSKHNMSIAHLGQIAWNKGISNKLIVSLETGIFYTLDESVFLTGYSKSHLRNMLCGRVKNKTSLIYI